MPLPEQGTCGGRAAAARLSKNGRLGLLYFSDTMAPDTPSEPSGRERREFYRITVLLPMCIQVAGDDMEGELTETSVNLSAGGIGVMVTTE